jgi:OOP family OmpA-OmpF porin
MPSDAHPSITSKPPRHTPRATKGQRLSMNQIPERLVPFLPFQHMGTADIQQEDEMRSRSNRQRTILGVLLAVCLGMSTAAYADDDIRGVITARGHDGTLMVRTDDSSSVIVVLDDTTRVRRTDGLREMKISSASLIPGLRVQIEGIFLAANRFAAHDVKFSRSDLKTALAIKGGVDPTDARSLENQKRIDESAMAIERNARTIEQQRQTLQKQERLIAANADSIARTGMAVAAANHRIASLADHEVKSSMTVYFHNNSASIGRKQKEDLERLAQQAHTIRGVVIQVEGHASAVGSEALNQRLSMQRAHAVAAVLSQNGIAPTQMLFPATMGVSSQAAANTTSKGQSENRRVVVTVLQNKAIAQSSAANPGSPTAERVKR